MVELPLLENGSGHIVCLSCQAKSWKEGKYYCDEDKLKHKPIQCPREDLGNGNKVDAYAILRNKLRRLGR